MVRNLKRAGIPVLVVLISGRPLVIDEILPLADAVVAAWLPGTEGDGVADVLEPQDLVFPALRFALGLALLCLPFCRAVEAQTNSSK